MGLLALKLAITPLLILTSSLAGRYWGEAIGGWLIGLPLTSGPVAFILALEQGPEFVARLSLGSLAGVTAQAVFGMAYWWFADRGWRPTLLAGEQGTCLSPSHRACSDGTLWDFCT